MAYANIPDGDIDAESPGNVSLFTRLRDNPEAIALGLSGATRIVSGAFSAGAVDQAAIGSSAVHQAELSTGTQETSNVGTACSNDNFTAPDGYGFFPEIRTSSGSGSARWCSHVTFQIAGSTSTGYGDLQIGKSNTTGGVTSYIRIRYVNSSPPYDFGDGQVARFVYVEAAPNGDIVRTMNADDPPWASLIDKGARRIDRTTGKTYIKRPIQALPRWADVADDKQRMDAYAVSLASLECEWVELTQAMKMDPMSRRPSAWNDRLEAPNHQVIIEPASDILHRIQEAMLVDPDISPSALIHEGYLEIDNTPLSRAGPPGVPVHGVKWRLRGR